MSEKRFDPTQQRLQRARAEGDLPKAAELVSTMTFAAAGLGALYCLPLALQTTQTYLGALLRSPGDAAAKVPMTCAFIVQVIGLCLIPQGLAACTSVGVRLAHTGGRCAPLGLKPERLLPWSAIKELCSRHTVMTFVRALIGAAACIAGAAPVINGAIAQTRSVMTVGALAALTESAALRLFSIIFVVGFISACIDAFISQAERKKKLRMSFDELRREAKESNGDPHLKHARKRRHRAFMRGGVAAVPKATVVIVNPTHVAVALLYDPPAVQIPIVLALGVDDGALHIREIAVQHAVTIVEDRPLARLLLARCTEGDAIPVESFEALAPIIASVLSRQGSAI